MCVLNKYLLSSYYVKWLKGYKYELDTERTLKEINEYYDHVAIINPTVKVNMINSLS